MAPGGPAEILAPAFRALPFTRTSTLWVDEPVDESDGRVRVASQLVDVTSPYRRTPEPLSAAALIGPLHLGVTDALNGRFSTPDPPGLLTLDPRGRLVLTQPLDPPGPPLPPRPENEVSAAAFRIDRAIAEMVEPILLTENVSDALYQRLEREATAILEGFRTRGDVTSYIVRCNAETSEGADGPVIEVRIREPKRVDELVLRCHRM